MYSDKVLAAAALFATSALAQGAGSPTYNYIFQQALPIPPVATPIISETLNGVTLDYYESTIEAFQQQVYPNLGPANLVGYNGTAPGPTYIVPRGHETIIRYYNKGSEAAAVHLHGSATHAAWDGWASDLIQPGQYKDYYYPNYETARPMWYHDHADGHTASDAYYGQAGCYIVYDPNEDALGLPSGNYDIPLTITDKIYQSNGDLASPTTNAFNFYGDVIQVNEMPWPYFNVEPRKYRLRFFDMSLSRAYDLYFADQSGNHIQFQVISSDSGLFGAPVSSSDVTISPGERYEVVIDFSAYQGQNITLGNQMKQAQITDFTNTNKVMQFNVGSTVSDSTNNGAVPSTLNGAITWPAQRTVVDHVFNFQMGGDATWTINGIDFADVNNRVLAKPPQGTVELWELRHTGGPAIHPVHVHLVNLQVISRTGGTRGVLPYESAGLKDVVLLEPGEVVQVRAFYGPWNGLYMFHCHNLIHEDNNMMAVFNTTLLTQFGYYNQTQQFSDPMDTRFAAKAYNDADFSQSGILSAISSFGAFNAYGAATSLISAENAYYATAGYNGDGTFTTQTKTAAASSSGFGFPSPSVQRPTSIYHPTPSRPAAATGRTGRPGVRDVADVLGAELPESLVTAAPSIGRAFRA